MRKIALSLTLAVGVLLLALLVLHEPGVLAGAPEYQPGVSAPLTNTILYLPRIDRQWPPISDTLVSQYLFVEKSTVNEPGDDCIQFWMPTPFFFYYFYPGTGILSIYWALPDPPPEPGNIGFFGNITGYRGTGGLGGAFYSLSAINEVPYGVTLFSLDTLDSSGAISLHWYGERIDLAVGAEWVTTTVGLGPWPGGPECMMTTTTRLTNYGFQDRSDIVYGP